MRGSSGRQIDLTRAGALIEADVAADRWAEARGRIEEMLREFPADHWLHSRLALTFYEQGDYAEALHHERRALQLAPGCPLVVWGAAGAYEMLGDDTLALTLFQSLIDRDVDGLLRDPCNEGRAWAKGLVCDAHFRASRIHRRLGNFEAGEEAFEAYLDMRGPGCYSIYVLGDGHFDRAREAVRKLKRSASARRMKTQRR